MKKLAAIHINKLMELAKRAAFENKKNGKGKWLSLEMHDNGSFLVVQEPGKEGEGGIVLLDASDGFTYYTP